MVLKNDIRYRIDTLLRMANITTSEEKRNQYLLTIEELLSCDTEKIDTVEVPFGDEEKMKVINAFVDDYKVSNIPGKTNTQVYDEYLTFCNDIKSEPLPKYCSVNTYEKVRVFTPYRKKSMGKTQEFIGQIKRWLIWQQKRILKIRSKRS